MAVTACERLQTTYKDIQEISAFTDLEQEGESLIAKFTDLGIWNRLEGINRLEPSLRCATTASHAAQKLNELAALGDIKPIVSPKVTFMVGLLFKAGQAIDEQIIASFRLDKLDPHSLGLYQYPSYAPERTIATSRVLRLALLLHKLGHPWYAKAVLHGPHPQFFEGAELPTVLTALTNANLAENNQGEWHSYLHPAVGLLAIDPYAQRRDELAPQEAKDWVDRTHSVAINTTLQHILRMYAGVNFTDEPYEMTEKEEIQRWIVINEVFKQLGFPIPTKEEYAQQEAKLTLLKAWISEYQIETRLKNKQEETGHKIYDHTLMVSNLLRHLARMLNRLSQRFEGRQILNEDYLAAIGLCHDAPKAFAEEELKWLLSLSKYEKDFQSTYPPEVVARGTVSLQTNYDAQLYAWLRHFEDRYPIHPEYSSLANDFLSGAYHLSSFTSALLSYTDLAVVKKQEEKPLVYQTDITARFLDTTRRYVSDPHTAIIGYAKLITLVASLSWYLGLPLPKEGSTEIQEADLEIMSPKEIIDSQTALFNLQQIGTVFNRFGIAIPQELRSLL